MAKENSPETSAPAAETRARQGLRAEARQLIVAQGMAGGEPAEEMSASGAL